MILSLSDNIGMNKPIHYSILLTLSLILVACTSAEDNITSYKTDDIEIAATIVSTRANIDESGEGNFISGDKIRLFATANNSAGRISRILTFNGNKWSPNLKWSELNASKTVLSSFYPANNNGENSSTFVHEIASDQSLFENFHQSDLLYAKDELTENESVANLSFSHIMSRLIVRLKSDGSFSEEDISKATISLKAVSRMTVNCMTGELGIPNESEEKDIIMHHTQGNTFMAIVCPQKISERWRNEKWMEIRIGNKTIIYKAPEMLSDKSKFDELQKGKQITLNISLKKEETDWKNKTVWVYGINNPPVNSWGYASVVPKEEKGLKWNDSYGWYDCNKTYPNGGYGNNDSNLCWAASSSNLLHWWLEQNKEYIDRYGKYTGPIKYNNSKDSEIFNLYKKEFPNTGNEVAAALSWFITGRYGMTEKEGAGFFKDVFGLIHVARITRFSERTFPDELKKAFSEKSAIECTIRYPNQQLIHAITIWGADFDSKGDVSAIYITENNDRDVDEQSEYIDYKNRVITQAGILQKRVQKKSDGSYYMESSIAGVFNFRIEELNILGLMEDKWEEYFAKHVHTN